jgi:hypothetical protein
MLEKSEAKRPLAAAEPIAVGACGTLPFGNEQGFRRIGALDRLSAHPKWKGT